MAPGAGTWRHARAPIGSSAAAPQTPGGPAPARGGQTIILNVSFKKVFFMMFYTLETVPIILYLLLRPQDGHSLHPLQERRHPVCKIDRLPQALDQDTTDFSSLGTITSLSDVRFQVTDVR